MLEVDTDQLKQAVENMHGCKANYAQSVPVRESFEGKPVWESIVSIFRLVGHPKADQAYAWSSPVEGSDKRRVFAVLHIPPIDSPVAAVRAAIAQERGSTGAPGLER